MIIYIASSWKNKHGVVMLTEKLRTLGHTVHSFIENNYGEGKTVAHDRTADASFDFDEWVLTANADKAFEYDTGAALYSDLTIYYGPSGKDAVAECAMAYANAKPVIALWAKGEDLGLMRKMMRKWFVELDDMFLWIENYTKEI